MALRYSARRWMALALVDQAAVRVEQHVLLGQSPMAARHVVVEDLAHSAGDVP